VGTQTHADWLGGYPELGTPSNRGITQPRPKLAGSLKSLYCFLRTLILNPWLAREVKTIAIHGWNEGKGNPRYLCSEWFLVPEAKSPADWEEIKIDLPGKSNEDFTILQKAIKDLDLDKETVGLFKRPDFGVVVATESTLISLILTRLPCFSVMKIVAPFLWDKVCDFFAKSSIDMYKVLPGLETVYICPRTSEFPANLYQRSLKYH
jgi:hypothetical protein